MMLWLPWLIDGVLLLALWPVVAVVLAGLAYWYLRR